MRLPFPEDRRCASPQARDSGPHERRLAAAGRVPAHHTLDACFLGPYGENDGLLEKLMVEFLRDHVYWRRNFHPEDPPAIATAAAHHPDYLAFEARMRRELHQLSAALKKSVPFHSPRYIGHMASDLLLPGLAAQMLTLPYNPNNVSEDAAPVTVDMEVQVGLQLARMLGYPHDPARAACAFGHLTSGGTLANYQALRLALALKAFPVALRAAGVPDLALPADDWSAFNLAHADTIALLEPGSTGWPRNRRASASAGMRASRRSGSSSAAWSASSPPIRSCGCRCVLAPITAHYSWSKGLKLLGLGRDQLRAAADPRHAPGSRRAGRHAGALRARTPAGADVRGGARQYRIRHHRSGRWRARRARRVRARGGWISPCTWMLHGAATWPRCSVTRTAACARARTWPASSHSFPTPAVHAAFAALGDTDSVTVDPHKLGYLPYGAGAFICRDHRAMALLAERADYVFHGSAPADYLARYRSLGQFVPEGSKSGAAAAAVYVTHKVLPLDHAHFGRLPAHTVHAAEAFHRARASGLRWSMADTLHVLVPFAAGQQPGLPRAQSARQPRGGAGQCVRARAARHPALRPAASRCS